MRRVVRASFTNYGFQSPQGVNIGETVINDTYNDRLTNYIPADVVAVYLTLQSTAKAAGDGIDQVIVQWLIFAIVLGLTPFYVNHNTKLPGIKPAIRQIIISTLAFIVWVFALGGPFALMSWYHPVYGAIVLPLYTFLIPIIKGEVITPLGS